MTSATRPDRAARAGRRWRGWLIVLLAALGARAAFLLFLPQVFSRDVVHWSYVARALVDGENPYEVTTFLNWPPLWMTIVWALARIHVHFGVDFVLLVRLTLILIELAVLFRMFRLLALVAPDARATALLVVGICLDPIAVLQICQHGNFDVLVGLWVVLFLIHLVLFQRGGGALDFQLACLFLGLAILTKTVPLVLMPLLIGAARRVSPRARLLGAVLALGPVVLGMSLIYAQAPEGVTRNVLAYRSTGGYFGISGVLELVGLARVASAWGAAFPWLLLAGLAALSSALWRRALRERELVLASALLLAAVPALGPGYSPQYVYWYLPLLVVSFACHGSRWRGLLLASYAIAACTYLVEYALFDSHGSFLVALRPEDPRIARWSAALSTPGAQTLVRLPLFVTFLVLLSAGAVLVWRSRVAPADGVAAGSHSSLA